MFLLGNKKFPQNCKGQKCKPTYFPLRKSFDGSRAGLAPTHQFSAGIQPNKSHRTDPLLCS